MKALLLALAATLAAFTSAAAQTADRLYVMDCGHNAATDQSRWSPGVNVGKPIELSDNCYLIRHGASGCSGTPAIPTRSPTSRSTAPVGTATRAKTLAEQLAEIGVKPADISFVAVSHTHGDHVGNVDMFPASTLLIQKAEFDWAFAQGKRPPFKTDRPIRAARGRPRRVRRRQRHRHLDAGPHAGPPVAAGPPAQDRLDRAGGDAAHFKDNWDNRRVPSMNTSAEQTQASYKRMPTSWPRRTPSSGSTTTSRRASARSSRRSSTTETARSR